MRSNYGILILLFTLIFSSNSFAADQFASQVYDSALAYGRSTAEAKEASAKIHSVLALQTYLTVSTSAYYETHSQAIQTSLKIPDYSALQIYLTLRTPTYHHSPSEALAATLRIKSTVQFQIYLHFLVIGTDPQSALDIAEKN